MYLTRFISSYHVPTPFQPWFTFSAMFASAEPILMSSFMVSSTISFSSYTSTTPYFTYFTFFAMLNSPEPILMFPFI